MSDNWDKILKKNIVPEIDKNKKYQAIEFLKTEIKNTDIEIKESYFQKIIKQLPFISKKIILVQFLFLILGLLIIYYTSFESTRLLLSLVMPILAFFQVAEIQRSFKYNMYEIEMACKVNLREIITTRLIIMTVINLLIMTLFVIIAGAKFQEGIHLLIVYLLVPFLVTNVLTMEISKLLKSKQNDVANISIALIINMFLFVSHIRLPYIYENSSIFIWIIVLFISGFYLIKNIYQIYEKEDEYIWNLQ